MLPRLPLLDFCGAGGRFLTRGVPNNDSFLFARGPVKVVFADSLLGKLDVFNQRVFFV